MLCYSGLSFERRTHRIADIDTRSLTSDKDSGRECPGVV